MRPLYFLWNKILTVDEDIWEEKVDGSDGDDVNAGEWQLIQPSSGGRKWQDQALPRSHFVEVPHVQQLHSWDCGLACVLMALNTVGINHCSIQALADLCCITSIWTVDLAYLLQRFSVPFSYFTVTLGANPNYSAETFYKEQLPNDLVRVDMLFQKALEQGINIQCRAITENQISHLILSKKYIAIALVDQYKLSRSLLKDVLASGLNSNYLGYAGHYVVICGYDACADEFEIRDPASSRNFERISSKCLEEARKSFGTDEDLLLISLEKSDRQNSSSMPLVHLKINAPPDHPYKYFEWKIRDGLEFRAKSADAQRNE